MKKLFFLSAFLFVNVFFLVAQSSRQFIVLDNYLIPQDEVGAIVGRIIKPGDAGIIISKDPSELFWLDDYGYIRLREDTILTNTSPNFYDIEIEYGDLVKSFQLVKDNFLDNKVIAQRGAWKNQGGHHAAQSLKKSIESGAWKSQNLRQNSLMALKKAIDIGCGWSECDVWLSADNEVMVSDDATIGGWSIEDTQSKVLSDIPLSNGDFVANIEDFINTIKTQNQTRLMIEIKSSNKGSERTQTLTDSCIQIVQRMNAQAWVDYATSDYDVALTIRELDPTAQIFYLQSDKELEQLESDQISGIDYQYSNFVRDEELISKAKEIGLVTGAWVVNSRTDMEYLVGQGIDYITTDDPEVLLDVLKKGQ